MSKSAIGLALWTATICFSQRATAQYWPNHIWDNWYFGHGGGLTFENGECQPLLNNPDNSLSSGMSVTASSPTTGELRLVANGALWSGNGNVLIGYEQFANFVGTANFAIPKPGSTTDWFWIVHATDTNLFNVYLNAIEIDAVANGGNGAFLNTGIDLGSDRGQRLVAIPSASNDTVWIIADDRTDSSFYSYPVTSAGIGAPHFAGPVQPTYFQNDLAAKADRQGSKFLSTGDAPNNIFLHQFDHTMGLTNELISIEIPSPYGHGDMEFSPNGRLLYVNVSDENQARFHIWQYDLAFWDSLAIAGSRVAIEADSTLRTFAMQLAPNDKIYTWTGNADSTHLSVINTPNEAGVACDHALYSVALPSGIALGDLQESRPNVWWPAALPNVGIATNSAGSMQLRAYPNPALEQIRIALPPSFLNNGSLAISWFDTSGRKVSSEAVPANGDLALGCGHLDTGVYEVRIATEKGLVGVVRVNLL